MVWPDQTWTDLTIRAFHFAPFSTFSWILELIPCHGMWTAKQCHFYLIKTPVLVCAQQIIFFKYYGKQKKNHSRFHIWNLKGSPWWVDSKYGLRIEIGWYFDPYFGRKYTENRSNRDSGLFWRFFGKIRGQILSQLNSEYIFGIPHQGNHFRPPYERGNETLFSDFYVVFSTKKILLCANQKAVFMGENNNVLLFTSRGIGLAPKTWRKLSAVHNETP